MYLFLLFLPMILVVAAAATLYFLIEAGVLGGKREEPSTQEVPNIHKPDRPQPTQMSDEQSTADASGGESESPPPMPSAAPSLPPPNTQTLRPFQMDPKATYIEEEPDGLVMGPHPGAGLYGYEDEGRNVVIEAQFEVACRFSEGLAVVQVEGKCGYIDGSGEFVIPPQYDLPVAYEDMYFREGLAAVRLNEKYGYINKDGNLVVEPQFVRAAQFEHGYGLAKVEEGYIVFDRNGELVVSQPFSTKREIYEGPTTAEVSEHSEEVEVDGKSVRMTLTTELAPSSGWAIGADWPEGLPLDMPIRMELSNGVLCDFDISEGIEIHGEQVRYTCSDGSRILGGLLEFTQYQAPRVTEVGIYVVRKVTIEKSDHAYEIVDSELVGVETAWIRKTSSWDDRTYVFIPTEPIVRSGSSIV
ncbi:MAG: WG repeat-containing protein [Chloroflexota bacterium]